MICKMLLRIKLKVFGLAEALSFDLVGAGMRSGDSQQGAGH